MFLLDYIHFMFLQHLFTGGVPEAFYRVNTLEGESGGTPPMDVNGGKITVESGFRSFHSSKMNSQDTQLILLVAFFLPKPN